MDITHSLHTATAGRKSVADSWVSPTALRPLICDDPCLVWLALHGKSHGFTKDPEEYSLLGWLGEQGGRFEEEWLRRIGGTDVVYANEHDHDVRQVKSVLRTAEAVARKAPLISKAALWWAPDGGLYGTADVLARVSWLRDRLPATRPFLEGEDPDSYVVMDCKNQTNLGGTDKKLDLKLASTQVRLYSHMVGNLFGGKKLAHYAFIIPRDRVLNPIPVEVGDPMDDETQRLLALYGTIKTEGKDLLPWRDELIAPNPWNKKNAPWSEAVKTIMAERMPSRSLHVIPHMGKRQAESLCVLGLSSIEDILAAGPHALRNARVPGFGAKTLAKAEAVLRANHADNNNFHVSIPHEAVPPHVSTQIYADFEFWGAGMKVDYNLWPDLRGREMCFMVGAGFEDERGEWRFKRFTATEDSLAAERRMWEEFVGFLRERGVIFGSLQEATPTPEGTAALYHWSDAEVHGSRRASERVGLQVLGNLPWVDLRKSFLIEPTALPGQWDYSLKSVSKALGRLSPEHRVDYPENLKVGSDAMIMALRAHERGSNVLSSPEIKLIGEYLEVDCKTLWQILRWLRASIQHEEEISSPRAVKGRTAQLNLAGGWYRRSLEMIKATPPGESFAPFPSTLIRRDGLRV